jgi:hypothetical protein
VFVEFVFAFLPISMAGFTFWESARVSKEVLKLETLLRTELIFTYLTNQRFRFKNSDQSADLEKAKEREKQKESEQDRILMVLLKASQGSSGRVWLTPQNQSLRASAQICLPKKFRFAFFPSSVRQTVPRAELRDCGGRFSNTVSPETWDIKIQKEFSGSVSLLFLLVLGIPFLGLLTFVDQAQSFNRASVSIWDRWAAYVNETKVELEALNCFANQQRLACSAIAAPRSLNLNNCPVPALVRAFATPSSNPACSHRRVLDLPAAAKLPTWVSKDGGAKGRWVHPLDGLPGRLLDPSWAFEFVVLPERSQHVD